MRIHMYIYVVIHTELGVETTVQCTIELSLGQAGRAMKAATSTGMHLAVTTHIIVVYRRLFCGQCECPAQDISN